MPEPIVIPTVHVLSVGLLLEYIDHGRLVIDETRPYAQPFETLRFDSARESVVYIRDDGLSTTPFPMASREMQDKYAWCVMGTEVKNMPYSNGIAFAVHNNLLAFKRVGADKMRVMIARDAALRLAEKEERKKHKRTYSAISPSDMSVRKEQASGVDKFSNLLRELADEDDNPAKRPRNRSMMESMKLEDVFWKFVNLDFFPPDGSRLVCDEECMKS